MRIFYKPEDLADYDYALWIQEEIRSTGISIQEERGLPEKHSQNIRSNPASAKLPFTKTIRRA